MRKFRVLSGGHQGPGQGPGEGEPKGKYTPGKMYEPGDFVETDTDLVAKFGSNMFEEVDPAAVKRYRATGHGTTQVTLPSKGRVQLRKGDIVESDKPLPAKAFEVVDNDALNRQGKAEPTRVPQGEVHRTA